MGNPSSPPQQKIPTDGQGETLSVAIALHYQRRLSVWISFLASSPLSKAEPQLLDSFLAWENKLWSWAAVVLPLFSIPTHVVPGWRCWWMYCGESWWPEKLLTSLPVTHPNERLIQSYRGYSSRFFYFRSLLLPLSIYAALALVGVVHEHKLVRYKIASNINLIMYFWFEKNKSWNPLLRK